MEAKNLLYEDWGMINYSNALERQTNLYETAIADKLKGEISKNIVVSCEHPCVYTIGKSGKDSNMLLSESAMNLLGVEFFHIKRGGDVTFHGPGQIVLYPIIDLEQFGLGLKSYIYILEEAVILLCKKYGVIAGRLNGATGVWIEPGTVNERKICAIGVQSSHFITMHGLAFNINTDLKYFSYINPCGFVDKGVTSLSVECGKILPLDFLKIELFEILRSLLLKGG